jgi:hypothetical protein
MSSSRQARIRSEDLVEVKGVVGSEVSMGSMTSLGNQGVVDSNHSETYLMSLRSSSAAVNKVEEVKDQEVSKLLRKVKT